MSYARIIGTGSYMPKKILTNADLEKIVDTSDEWIMERTGIKERHIIAEDEQLVDMAEKAARRAIEAAAIDPSEIGLVINATATSDYTFPSSACILQHRLGLTAGCPAFDVAAACAGFIYGLSIAEQYIKSGAVKTVLLVASEALSRVVNWEDRTTCVLFSDGAGAVVLTADSKPGIRAVNIHADGKYLELLNAPNSHSKEEGKYIKMRGNEVFKVAVTKLGKVARATLDMANLDSSELDWLVPHQANWRIINATAKKLKLPLERVIQTVEKHGNTSAASVPLALDYGIRSGKIKKGDTMLMEAFGAAFTWGAALADY